MNDKMSVRSFSIHDIVDRLRKYNIGFSGHQEKEVTMSQRLFLNTKMYQRQQQKIIFSHSLYKQNFYFSIIHDLTCCSTCVTTTTKNSI